MHAVSSESPPRMRSHSGAGLSCRCRARGLGGRLMWQRRPLIAGQGASAPAAGRVWRFGGRSTTRSPLSSVEASSESQGLGPALPRPPAPASPYIPADNEKRSQPGIGLPTQRHRLVNDLAGIAVSVECCFGRLDIPRWQSRCRRENGSGPSKMRFGKYYPSHVRTQTVRKVPDGAPSPPEFMIVPPNSASRNPSRPRRRRRRLILLTAIVLRQLPDQCAARPFSVGVAAFQTLEVGHGAIKVVAHLPNLRVDRLTVRSASGEKRKKPAAFAAEPL